MWNSLYFALLLCLTICGKTNGQKDIKFLVLVEDNAQMDLKTSLGNGLAGAQNANGGFTFAMKDFQVVYQINSIRIHYLRSQFSKFVKGAT